MDATFTMRYAFLPLYSESDTGWPEVRGTSKSKMVLVDFKPSFLVKSLFSAPNRPHPDTVATAKSKVLVRISQLVHFDK